jgi:ABC-type sugar transport system ATPase subunit
VTQALFLDLRHIRKAFGNFTALHDINLQIRKGEFVCFLGPSGCGKTTLLRIIAGLEVQSAGEVWQAGRDISRLPPAQRDYGIVFQSYALFPNLSVADNVAYGLVNRKDAARRHQPRVSPSWSSWSACRAAKASTPASCRAVSSNALHWRVRWPLRRACCCWTSRCRHWTRWSGCACARKSAPCSRHWV